MVPLLLWSPQKIFQFYQECPMYPELFSLLCTTDFFRIKKEQQYFLSDQVETGVFDTADKNHS